MLKKVVNDSPFVVMPDGLDTAFNIMLAIVTLAIVLIMLKGKPSKLFLSMLMPILNRMVDELTLEIRHTFHHASRRSQHLGVSKTMKRRSRHLLFVNSFAFSLNKVWRQYPTSLPQHGSSKNVDYCDFCAKSRKKYRVTSRQSTVSSKVVALKLKIFNKLNWPKVKQKLSFQNIVKSQEIRVEVLQGYER